MAWRDVRVREVRNKLAFRYEDELDLIEVMVEGRKVIVRLDDYRPIYRRRLDGVGVDFAHIAGESLDG